MPEKGWDKLAAQCFAMSYKNRIKILFYLLEHGKAGTNEVAEVIGRIPSEASMHIKVLVKSGLIVQEFVGRYHYCHLVDKKFVKRLIEVGQEL